MDGRRFSLPPEDTKGAEINPQKATRRTELLAAAFDGVRAD
jgi:hypothetical protein